MTAEDTSMTGEVSEAAEAPEGAGVSYIYRAPRMTPASRGAKPPAYRQEVADGMLIERDVAVTIRTGDTIWVNVFRPVDGTPAAPIIAWTPYGKDEPVPIGKRYPNAGVRPEWTSDYTNFEAPDPAYWVPHGYAIVVADIPGTFRSEGRATFCSPEEAEAFYDLIEWAGTRSWSNGKVGLSGVSYLTVTQWRVAELHPPHLAAINPWEGWTDTYREVVRHGGIPDSWFWPYLWDRWGASSTEIEDLEAETATHPFDDAFWQSKSANLEAVTVPAFVVASWSDQGLHTRGTLEGFKRIASERKWLDVHGRKKWGYYYEPRNVERQRAFFDSFLKGLPTEVSEWPRVRLEVRAAAYEGKVRAENEWPLARTDYRELHLGAPDRAPGFLSWEPVEAEGRVAYDGLGSGPGRHRAEFEVTFAEPVELVGHMKAALYMSAPDADDLDVFVAVWKLDRAGEVMRFPYYAHFEDGPVAVGWLRASHRELDPERSTDYQPVLAHRRELPVPRGEVVRLDVEIWPSGTRFDAGEGLRLVVQGTDVNRYPKPLVYARHEDSVNRGPHVIHTGGRYDSHLLVPVVPSG